MLAQRSRRAQGMEEEAPAWLGHPGFPLPALVRSWHLLPAWPWSPCPHAAQPPHQGAQTKAHHRHPSAPPASPAALPAPQSAAPPPATGWEGRKKNINDYYKELKRNCKCYFSCRWMIAGWMIDSWMDGSLSLQAVTPFQSLPPERCCHLVSAQKGFYWLTGGCTRTGY